VFDFSDPRRNEFLVARQYVVRGDRGAVIRTDLTVLVNGLPVAVIELKDPTDEQADI
jgi:type I restriction enzyme R subunit